jgi:hypothetical protein
VQSATFDRQVPICGRSVAIFSYSNAEISAAVLMATEELAVDKPRPGYLTVAVIVTSSHIASIGTVATQKVPSGDLFWPDLGFIHKTEQQPLPL